MPARVRTGTTPEEARGFARVLRLAARLRRRREGRPNMKLVDTTDAGAGREPGAGREAPGGRTPRPAPLRLVREGDRGRAE